MEMKNEILDIRKILVKAPPLKEDIFKIFPFLIALSENFPKAEIHLLCEKDCSLAYQFLPFKLRVFERPREKTGLIQTHHFCANLHDIFNIDLFFDLENSLNSSFMGFNFRARQRVGFETGWNKYFLTKKFPNIDQSDAEKKSLKLLELFTEKNYQDVKISRIMNIGVQIETIEKLFQEPEPPKFVMIMLDNFQNVSTQISLWIKFFDSFQTQKFIIWSQNDEDLISELFSSVDLGGNNLYMHKGTNIKELIYLFRKVKGVVVNNIWSEGLCLYLGVNAVTFLDNQTSQLPNYYFFQFHPQRFIISSEGPIKYTYLDEESELVEMNEVVDRLHFYFKL